MTEEPAQEQPMAAKGEASGIPIFCAYDKIENIDKLVPHPNNPNTHSQEQIDLLARFIKARGWRHPITISQRSGFIIFGYCRLMSAQNMGLETVPVEYQNFENEADEVANLIADNKIHEFSEFSLQKLGDNFVLLDEQNYDLQLTGFSQLEIENIILGPNKAAGGVGEANAGGEAPDWDDNFVDFKFHIHKGRVGKDLYDQFVGLYNKLKAENDLVMLDDILRKWLNVGATEKPEGGTAETQLVEQPG